MKSALHKNARAVKSLLEREAESNIVDNFKKTAHTKALIPYLSPKSRYPNPSIEIVNILIAVGADVTQTTENKEIAAEWALKQHCSDTLK